MSDATIVTPENAERFYQQFDESKHPRDETGKFSARGIMRDTQMYNGIRLTAEGGMLPPHLSSLRIPPAWTDVKYHPDPKADLLVIGKDAKGRDQYVYSETFRKSQAEAKFNRIAELDEKYDSIKKQNDTDRLSDSPRVRDSADAAHLIMQTGIRPGGDADTQAKVKAYGATTLLGKHVVQSDSGVSLQFTGKKGVALNIPISDPQTASMLQQRAASAGPEGKLFPATNDKALLDHVHGFDGGGFKTKDFRTLVATRSAREQMKTMPVPENEKAYKKAVLGVAKAVSAKLGNTPIVALQSYINPSVFAAWRMRSEK